ncbi:MAG: IS1634 family transposase, partial [Methanosarcinaceae archaeon]
QYSFRQLGHKQNHKAGIADVTTLKNTILKLEAYGVKDYTLVMDRGFFSAGNLKELLNDTLSFIMPATYALKSMKVLMSKAQKEVKLPQYLQKLNKKPIFVKPVTLTLNGSEIEGYCYYDPKREQDERNTFYSRLHDIIEYVQKKAIPSWKKPVAAFKERAKEMANYLNWTVVEDHFEITIKKNAVTRRVNRMGCFFIFYRGEFDWMMCLSTYRERDIIEKGFDTLKNDLQALPLNAKTESTIRGLLFVNYLSLIVRIRLINQMRESGLLKNYTVEKLLLELEKIKKIQLANEDVIVSEITKKQNDILEVLGLCA